MVGVDGGDEDHYPWNGCAHGTREGPDGPIKPSGSSKQIKLYICRPLHILSLSNTQSHTCTIYRLNIFRDPYSPPIPHNASSKKYKSENSTQMTKSARVSCRSNASRRKNIRSECNFVLRYAVRARRVLGHCAIRLRLPRCRGGRDRLVGKTVGSVVLAMSALAGLWRGCPSDRSNELVRGSLGLAE